MKKQISSTIMLTAFVSLLLLSGCLENAPSYTLVVTLIPEVEIQEYPPPYLDCTPPDFDLRKYPS
ncbi:MAG: hypothetical protein ACW99F_08055, partial [Candidatus Hodarchaeales archaeon]